MAENCRIQRLYGVLKGENLNNTPQPMISVSWRPGMKNKAVMLDLFLKSGGFTGAAELEKSLPKYSQRHSALDES